MIEFMVVLGIMLVMTIAISRFQKDIFTMNRTSQEGLRAQQELRRVLGEIRGELRNARTSSAGSYPLETAASSSLIFYSDTTGDRKPERLRYFVSEGNLRRGVVSPSGSPLSYDLTGEQVDTVVRYLVTTTTPVFRYYDGSYTGAGAALEDPLDISRVRMVGLSLTIDKDKTKAPGPITVETFATVRELKDNL